jgi:hypothetical protein
MARPETAAVASLRAANGAPSCSLAIAGDDAFLSWDAVLEAPPDAPLVAYLAGAPKALLAAHHTFAAPGALVLRRSRVEPVLAAALAAGLVRLRAVAMSALRNPARPRPGAIADTDFCLVEPRIHIPADRAVLAPHAFARPSAGADAASATPARESARLSVLDGGPFAAGWAPGLPVFRVDEFPLQLWVDAATQRALAEALPDALAIGAISPSPGFPFAPSSAPAGVSEAVAVRAAEALARARDAARRAGAREATDWPTQLDAEGRAAICASPRHALLLARVEGPRDDTRAGALREPPYAVAYARDVDAGPRDDTRAAAARDPESAIDYARMVDRGAHPALREALVGSHRRDAWEDAALRASKRALLVQAASQGETPANDATTRAAKGTRATKKAPHAAVEDTTKDPAKDRAKPRKNKAAVASGAPPAQAATLDAGEPHEVVALKGEATAVYVNVLWSHGAGTAHGLALADDDVTVTFHDGKAGDRLAAALPEKAALSDRGVARWVLRRDVAESMFEGVPGVRLLRVRVVQRGAAIPADFVYVDVTAERPLDRDAAGVSVSGADPWASFVLAVDTVRVVGVPRPPGGLELARVAEFPEILVASAPLVARWKKLRAPVQVIRAPHAHLRPLPRFRDDGDWPAWPGDGARAAAAWRTLAAGGAGDRATALASPWPAYLLARLLDRAPADDTRRAACAHPATAALYARFVDRAPHPDTRDTALATSASALDYALYVDRALDPRARPVLRRVGWPDADLDALAAKLAAAPKHALPVDRA